MPVFWSLSCQGFSSILSKVLSQFYEGKTARLYTVEFKDKEVL
jgi:hypothetical protein